MRCVVEIKYSFKVEIDIFFQRRGEMNETAAGKVCHLTPLRLQKLEPHVF